MKIKFTLIVLLLTIVIVSCSDSKMFISTTDNYNIVNLPDGSTAFLNSNSSLEYDEIFAKRIVRQTGEVYYDVAKGKSQFHVLTEKGEIIVLGTKFNVKSDLEKLELEVEEGVVELQIDEFASKVKKGQKALFKEGDKELKMAKAEFKHHKWIKNLRKEFRKLGKEINKSLKQIERESGKSWKEIKKEIGN